MRNKENHRKLGKPPKNKRILKKEREKKQGRIALIIFFVIVSSPFWLYVGIFLK